MIADFDDVSGRSGTFIDEHDGVGRITAHGELIARRRTIDRCCIKALRQRDGAVDRPRVRVDVEERIGAGTRNPDAVAAPVE